jgi:hypothetical protein
MKEEIMQNQESLPVKLGEEKISTNLEAFGLKVKESMTTPSRPGKSPKPVWVVVGNIFGLESFFRDIGGRKFRGQWSFFKDPTYEIFEYLQNNKRLSYAEQIENQLERKLEKAERYESYSKNAETRSENSFKSANAISSLIPMGQPILIGHHSEGRHRKDLKRIDSCMQKSIEEDKKAKYFSEKSIRLFNADSKLENREFVGNRIDNAKTEISSLSKWANADNPRLIQAREKLEYWQSCMNQIESKMKINGDIVPMSETINVGDLINSIGWYPVVKINKKTVTVSHWLGVETLTYKIPYSKIKAVKSKPIN